jgi:hypothetical protein
MQWKQPTGRATCSPSKYRELPNIRGIGRTLYYYAQHFSCMHTGAKRQVYHNIPQWQWRPILQLATGQTKLRCIYNVTLLARLP